jgi:hypothetical protein
LLLAPVFLLPLLLLLLLLHSRVVQAEGIHSIQHRLRIAPDSFLQA